MKLLLRTFLIIFLTVTIFWCAGFLAFNVHVKSLPQNDKNNTDAIIVLTGGPDRINRGLDLLEQKKARYLFISGVNTQVSEKQLIDMWKPETKRPPCCIILGHEARNTAENAIEARDWIALNNVHSIRLLTTNYHMPRAQLEFAALLPDIDIHAHAISTHKKNWPFVVNEYNKTLFTLAKHSIAKE